MQKTIDSLRSLAATNAALLHSARQSQDAIADAAQQELAHINARLAAIVPGDAITDPQVDQEYRRLIFRRAQLHRLLADH